MSSTLSTWSVRLRRSGMAHRRGRLNSPRTTVLARVRESSYRSHRRNYLLSLVTIITRIQVRQDWPAERSRDNVSLQFTCTTWVTWPTGFDGKAMSWRGNKADSQRGGWGHRPYGAHARCQQSHGQEWVEKSYVQACGQSDLSHQVPREVSVSTLPLQR